MAFIWGYKAYEKARLPQHNTSYLSVMTRVDYYLFPRTKKGIQSINIWLIKKGAASPNYKYALYQDFQKYLCMKQSIIANHPIIPCKTVQIDDLTFIYRDFYTPKNNTYYRAYFTKVLNNMIIKMSVFSQRKINNLRLKHFISKYFQSLPVFWKINNPMRQYKQALSVTRQWQRQYRKQRSASLLPAAFMQRLKKTAQQLIQAIDKATLSFPKDPVITQFLQNYKTVIQNTNKMLLHPTAPSFNKRYTAQIKQINVKQHVLLSLLMPQDYWDNNDTGRDALAIQLLPYAESLLKKHPNNTALCLVLTTSLSPDAPPSINTAIIMAKKIAFLQQGHQYCPRFYNKLSTWGKRSLPKKAPLIGNYRVSDLPKADQKYYGMSYPHYVEKFVQPLMPNAIAMIKNPKKNKTLCQGRGYFPQRRNPKKDALRQAYLLKGKDYCPKKFLQPSALLLFNGVQCLSECKYLGVLGYPVDCIEKCKDTPGVLFK